MWSKGFRRPLAIKRKKRPKRKRRDRSRLEIRNARSTWARWWIKASESKFQRSMWQRKSLEQKWNLKVRWRATKRKWMPQFKCVLNLSMRTCRMWEASTANRQIEVHFQMTRRMCTRVIIKRRITHKFQFNFQRSVGQSIINIKFRTTFNSKQKCQETQVETASSRRHLLRIRLDR